MNNMQLVTELQKKNEALESKTKELAVLYEIARILGSQIDPDRALDEVSHCLKQVLSIDYFISLSYLRSIRELHFQFAKGMSQKTLKKLKVSKILIQENYTTSIKESNLKNSSNYFTGILKAYFTENGLSDLLLESFLCIPVVMENELYGILGVGSLAKDAFKENQQLLSTIALEVVSLYEKVSCLSRATQFITMGKIVSEIAHGLRHPITNIRGAVQHLESHWDNDDFRKKSFEVLNSSVLRLINQMEELNDFSNPAKSQNKVVDLNNTLDHVLTFLKHELDQRKISLIRRFSKDLKPVSVSEKRIEEAFLNIIINALEAMPHGGELRISTQNFSPSGNSSKTYILVKFADTGSGIPPQIQKQIFEYFYTTKKSGSGLGLAAVNRIIQSHKGYIKVESKQNKGATFNIFLPA